MKKRLKYVAQYIGSILFLMLPAVGENIEAAVMVLAASVGLLAAGGAFKFQNQR